MLHGSYVAFVFAVVLFGALAFRQISDNLLVKRLRMGEDRMAFVSAPGVLVALVGLLLTLGVGIYVYADPIPRIYYYALPLILGVQFTQVLMRVYMQRTLIKTRGFVFRSIAFERIRPVRFASVRMADLTHYVLWTKVTLTFVENEIDHVTFRIFPFSEKALRRILEGWCACEIRHLDASSSTSQRRTPQA